MGFYKDSNYAGQTVTIVNWCPFPLADGTHDKCDPCYHPVNYRYAAYHVPTAYPVFGTHQAEITTAYGTRPTDPGYTPTDPPPLVVYYGDGSLCKKYSSLQGLGVEFVIDGIAEQNFPTSTTWVVHWAYGGYYEGEPDGILWLDADGIHRAQQAPAVIHGEVPLVYSDDPSTPFGSDPSWVFTVIFAYAYILAIPA